MAILCRPSVAFALSGRLTCTNLPAQPDLGLEAHGRIEFPVYFFFGQVTLRTLEHSQLPSRVAARPKIKFNTNICFVSSAQCLEHKDRSFVLCAVLSFVPLQWQRV